MAHSYSRPIFIANPKSQNGALGRHWSEIRKTIEREFGAFDVRMTEAPRHATQLTRTALQEGADLVVAIGGDGTLHEVLNGFIDPQGESTHPKAALGFLPHGTGGDFRRTAGISGRIDEAARTLAAGEKRQIDVGHLTYRKSRVHTESLTSVFINIASFGLGGLVDQVVNSSSKALGGKASFLLGTLRAMVQYHNKKVRIYFDGDEDDFLEMRIKNVAVANGQYFGGGMQIAPNAELDDGLFDITIVGDLSMAELIALSPSVYKGAHLSNSKVVSRQAKSITAAPADEDTEILLDVDGEPLGVLPATFRVLPRAITLIVP